MPRITVNGREVEVGEGLNLIEACRPLGAEIPHYCYHPALSVVASCRMCLVEVEKAPKLLPACATLATEGMVVHTESPKVKEARERMLEFLLLNHPLDCPICDQAGECKLQDYSYEHGTVVSRFTEEKRVPPKKDLGGDVILYTTRCILCTRCTRFMSEQAGTAELGVMNRGARAEIDLYPGVELSEGITGNIVDICPVGALKSKDFLFQARVWNLEKTPTVCGGCAAGCNVSVETLRGQVKRVKPRPNPEVNGHWICDLGRFLFHPYYRDLERLTEPELRGAPGTAAGTRAATWAEALEAAAAGLAPYRAAQGQGLAWVGSAFATNEENYYLRRLGERFLPRAARALYPPAPPAEAKDRVFAGGFRIAADRTPNRRGALAMMGLDTDGLDALCSRIESGEVTGAVILGGAYTKHLGEAHARALARLRFLLVVDATRSELAAPAHLLLPGATWAEKSGTMTNDAGRVQRLTQALPPPGQAREEAVVLRHLARALGEDPGTAIPERIFQEIARNVPDYLGLTLEAL